MYYLYKKKFSRNQDSSPSCTLNVMLIALFITEVFFTLCGVIIFHRMNNPVLYKSIICCLTLFAIERYVSKRKKT